MNEPATMVVKADLGAVREAREFVGLVFGAWGLEDYVARTVISELATNAITHGSREGDLVVVRVYRREDGVPVVEAWDRSEVVPVVGVVDYAAESGRGLLLMEALVRRWGTRPLSEGGKVVWAEIEPVYV
ncbi:ATP-binding protein [Actinomadura livida]|uniref:Anti-sigma regulatory factor (Ser/Thr protein kinase) n=2 Tax=Actinomadura livida TaxID=79909 RepID=A0A7W7IIG6_9ACTN|nr:MULTISPECIES: ATP-binding protein [Actinomadura]MBB4777717.1 anti-sigma regulatory factor (Ser/Thr protein kinase) [Actinomadura catellatispora]